MNQLDTVCQGDPQLSQYHKLWQQDPHSMFFVPLAELLLDKGYAQEAQELCEMSLEHHPTSVSGRLVLAEACHRLSNEEAADRWAREILQLVPSNIEARRYLKQKVAPPTEQKEAAFEEEEVTVSVVSHEQHEQNNELAEPSASKLTVTPTEKETIIVEDEEPTVSEQIDDLEDPTEREVLTDLVADEPTTKNLAQPWQNLTMVDILSKQGAYREAIEIVRSLIVAHPDDQELQQRLDDLQGRIAS